MNIIPMRTGYKCGITIGKYSVLISAFGSSQNKATVTAKKKKTQNLSYGKQ